jgi:cytochrome P450
LREIEKYVGNGEDITYEEIKNIGYLDCVIHECLRIYQPANGIFIREATNDHMLGDLKIKKGTLIMISSLTNHYNDENFENASEFRPERWLNEEGVLKTVKPFTWLTFSAGQRSCLGKQLALLELKIIVIQILRRYEIKM